MRTGWLDIGPFFGVLVYGPRRGRGQEKCKKERRQYSATLTKKTWSKKGFLHELKDNFFWQDQRANPERAR